MNLTDWGGYGGIAAAVTLLIVCAQQISTWKHRPSPKWEAKYLGPLLNHKVVIYNVGNQAAGNVEVRPAKSELANGNTKHWKAAVDIGSSVEVELKNPNQGTWLEISWDGKNHSRCVTWVPLGSNIPVGEIHHKQQQHGWIRALTARTRFGKEVGPDATLRAVRSKEWQSKRETLP